MTKLNSDDRSKAVELLEFKKLTSDFGVESRDG